MTQLPLTFPIEAPRSFAAENHRNRARQILQDHPHLQNLLIRFAEEMFHHVGKIGMKAITERVRWEVMMQKTDTVNGLKLNNSHTAYFARWLSEVRPDLKLETRKVKY